MRGGAPHAFGASMGTLKRIMSEVSFLRPNVVYDAFRVFLLQPRINEGFVRYTTRVALTAFWPVAVVGVVASLVGISTVTRSAWLPDWKLNAPDWVQVLVSFSDIVIFGPLVETAMMFVIIWFLSRIRASGIWLAVASAVVWGLLHARSGVMIKFITAWPFFCFTIVLLELEKRSKDYAWVVVSVIHGIYNVFALALELVLARIFDPAFDL